MEPGGQGHRAMHERTIAETKSLEKELIFANDENAALKAQIEKLVRENAFMRDRHENVIRLIDEAEMKWEGQQQETRLKEQSLCDTIMEEERKRRIATEDLVRMRRKAQDAEERCATRSAEADQAHAAAGSLRDANLALAKEKEEVRSENHALKVIIKNKEDEVRAETFRAEDATREAQRARDELAAREREVRTEAYTLRHTDTSQVHLFNLPLVRRKWRYNICRAQDMRR